MRNIPGLQKTSVDDVEPAFSRVVFREPAQGGRQTACLLHQHLRAAFRLLIFHFFPHLKVPAPAGKTNKTSRSCGHPHHSAGNMKLRCCQASSPLCGKVFSCCLNSRLLPPIAVPLPLPLTATVCVNRLRINFMFTLILPRTRGWMRPFQPLPLTQRPLHKMPVADSTPTVFRLHVAKSFNFPLCIIISSTLDGVLSSKVMEDLWNMKWQSPTGPLRCLVM